MTYDTEKRYDELRHAHQRGTTLTEEEYQFVQDFAMTKLLFLISSDPNLMDALKRLKDK